MCDMRNSPIKHLSRHEGGTGYSCIFLMSERFPFHDEYVSNENDYL